MSHRREIYCKIPIMCQAIYQSSYAHTQKKRKKNTKRTSQASWGWVSEKCPTAGNIGLWSRIAGQSSCKRGGEMWTEMQSDPGSCFIPLQTEQNRWKGDSKKSESRLNSGICCPNRRKRQSENIVSHQFWTWGREDKKKSEVKQEGITKSFLPTQNCDPNKSY